MISKFRMEIVFCITSMIIWGVCSMLITAGNFHYALSLEEIKAQSELFWTADKYWHYIGYKIAALYALFGGCLGIFLAQYYQSLPEKEKHIIPLSELRRKYAGFKHYIPRTIAAKNTAVTGFAIGLTFITLAAIYILPTLQNELILANETHIRIIIGAIVAYVMSGAPVYISLAFLKKNRDDEAV